MDGITEGHAQRQAKSNRGNAMMWIYRWRHVLWWPFAVIAAAGLGFTAGRLLMAIMEIAGSQGGR